jgi:hypothetical protein
MKEVVALAAAAPDSLSSLEDSRGRRRPVLLGSSVSSGHFGSPLESRSIRFEVGKWVNRINFVTSTTCQLDAELRNAGSPSWTIITTGDRFLTRVPRPKAVGQRQVFDQRARSTFDALVETPRREVLAIGGSTSGRRLPSNRDRGAMVLSPAIALGAHKSRSRRWCKEDVLWFVFDVTRDYAISVVQIG